MKTYATWLLCVVLTGSVLGCDSGSEEGRNFEEPREIAIRVTGSAGTPFEGGFETQIFETCATSQSAISGTVPFDTTVIANAAEALIIHRGSQGALIRLEVTRAGETNGATANLPDTRIQAGFPLLRSCDS